MPDQASDLPMDAEDRLRFWRSMPKPDMHLHLFGAARPSTVLELSDRNRTPLKPVTVDNLEKDRFFIHDFSEFIEIFRDIRDCFVTPDDFERLAWEAFEDAHADGVRYVSLRLNWQYRAGETLSPAMIEAIHAARRTAKERFDMEAGCFIDFPGWERLSCADRCVAFAMHHRHLGILGVDMVGLHSPVHSEDIRSLNRAKREGLSIVAHAGEVRGPEELHEVLNFFPVSRIAHGLAAARDEAVLRRLANERVTIEVCPVSNLCTRRIQDIEDHPVRSFLDSGVPIVLASDDPMLFRTTLSEQYALLERNALLSTEELIEACQRGFETCCLGTEAKETLLWAFHQWHADPVH